MKKMSFTVDLTKNQDEIWKQINKIDEKLRPKKSWLRRIISWF